MKEGRTDNWSGGDEKARYVCREHGREIAYFVDNKHKEDTFLCSECYRNAGLDIMYECMDRYFEEQAAVKLCTTEDLRRHAKLLLDAFKKAEEVQKLQKAQLLEVTRGGTFYSDELLKRFASAERAIVNAPISNPLEAKKAKKFLPVTATFASTILADQLPKQQIVERILMGEAKEQHQRFPATQVVQPVSKKDIRLVYRASRDGFKAVDFHRCCDNKGPTLLLGKTSENRVFGAYTDIPWTSPDVGAKQQGQGTSFLFNFDGNKRIQVLFCLDAEREVYHYRDRLPVFGKGDFLALDEFGAGSCQTNSEAYYIPSGIEDKNAFLAGSRKFTVRELEIFTVQNCVDKPEQVSVPAPLGGNLSSTPALNDFNDGSKAREERLRDGLLDFSELHKNVYDPDKEAKGKVAPQGAQAPGGRSFFDRGTA